MLSHRHPQNRVATTDLSQLKVTQHSKEQSKSQVQVSGGNILLHNSFLSFMNTPFQKGDPKCAHTHSLQGKLPTQVCPQRGHSPTRRKGLLEEVSWSSTHSPNTGEASLKPRKFPWAVFLSTGRLL